MGTADPRLPSIELGRRTPAQHLFGPLQNLLPSASQSTPALSKHDGYHLSDLNDTNGEDFNVPRVIVSLALEEDQHLNSKTCEKWLSSCPALVKFAKVEAVYKSFSTLLLLSIPVFIWNLLPEETACSFVGYVTSTNLIKPSPKVSRAELLEQGPVAMVMDSVNSPKEKKGKTPLKGQSMRSCTPCKRKKIKCDASQPSCGTCERGASVCEYQFFEKKAPRKESYVKERNLSKEPSNSPINNSLKANDYLYAPLQSNNTATGRSVQHESHATPPESDWDTIIDTCFPTESGTEPQDWVFNFDSPVPPLESQERRLNISSSSHAKTFDETGGNSFYGTIALEDFAPWKVDTTSSHLPGSQENSSDNKKRLHPESSVDSASLTPGLPVLSDLKDPVNDNLSADDVSELEYDRNANVEMGEEREYQALEKEKLQSAQTLAVPRNSPKPRKSISERDDLARRSYPPKNWSEIADVGERRRIQNRIAQRKYRKYFSSFASIFRLPFRTAD